MIASHPKIVLLKINENKPFLKVEHSPPKHQFSGALAVSFREGRSIEIHDFRCQEVAASRRFRFKAQSDSAASTKAWGCCTEVGWFQGVWNSWGEKSIRIKLKSRFFFFGRDGSTCSSASFKIHRTDGGTIGVQSVTLDITQD